LKHNLNNDIDLNGFVKPGADINTITSSLTVDSKHLTSNDILVLWGDTNDVSKNNSKDGLKSLTEFVEIHNNTNIALMCVPHRHDLTQLVMCINEVATYNRKLIKLMKPHKHVTMIRTDLDRKFFNKHDMHMNKLGKERIALEMANTVANILLKREKVISLQRKKAQGDSVSDSPTEDNMQWKNVQGDSVSDSPTEGNIPLQKDLEVTPSITTNMEASLEVTAQEESRPRTSKRQKKPPTTKSENFLW
jgi:hypothetical protein